MEVTIFDGTDLSAAVPTYIAPQCVNDIPQLLLDADNSAINYTVTVIEGSLNLTRLYSKIFLFDVDSLFLSLASVTLLDRMQTNEGTNYFINVLRSPSVFLRETYFAWEHFVW